MTSSRGGRDVENTGGERPRAKMGQGLFGKYGPIYQAYMTFRFLPHERVKMCKRCSNVLLQLTTSLPENDRGSRLESNHYKHAGSSPNTRAKKQPNQTKTKSQTMHAMKSSVARANRFNQSHTQRKIPHVTSFDCKLNIRIEVNVCLFLRTINIVRLLFMSPAVLTFSFVVKTMCNIVAKYRKMLWAEPQAMHALKSQPTTTESTGTAGPCSALHRMSGCTALS